MSASASIAHVVLSPHLDDAALSCGGMIAAAVARGEPVLVVTICSAAPDPRGPFNSLATQLHRDWQLAADQVVTARLQEDAAALAVLGAHVRYLDELDCIYRVPEAYIDATTLFGAPAADDPLPARLQAHFASLAAEFPQARFYAPLAIGRHVDHQLTYTAAAGLPNLSFYEDFPYVIRPGAREQRLATLGRPFALETIAIDAVIEQRIMSVDCYVSQLANLFGTREEMPAAVRSYAAGVAPAGAAFGECYRTLIP